MEKYAAAAAAAKLLQSCLTLCDPIDRLLPGSSVPGILQARTLEWVAISFSNVGTWKVKVKLLSCVWLLATSWTAAYQAPLYMGFSRQENWSGVLFGPKEATDWKPLSSQGLPAKTYFSYSMIISNVPNHPKSPWKTIADFLKSMLKIKRTENFKITMEVEVFIIAFRAWLSVKLNDVITAIKNCV